MRSISERAFECAATGVIWLLTQICMERIFTVMEWPTGRNATVMLCVPQIFATAIRAPHGARAYP